MTYYIIKHIKEPGNILYVSYASKDFIEFTKYKNLARKFFDRETCIEAIKDTSYFPYDLQIEVINERF